jgi:hypothetical protein
MTFDRDTGDLVDTAELVRERMEADAITAALHGHPSSSAYTTRPNAWHIDDTLDPDDDTDPAYAGYRHDADDCAEDQAMHVIENHGKDADSKHAS